MGYAILSVTYRSSDSTAYIECATQDAMREKIKELQGLAQTLKIGVFLRSQSIEIVSRWESSSYSVAIGDRVE